MARSLVSTYTFQDFALGVYSYPATLGTAALLDRVSFKKCGGWLTNIVEEFSGAVFVCELQPGGALGMAAPGGAVPRVIVGYIAYEWEGVGHLHVNYLCGFVDGLCVGTVLLHAAARVAEEHRAKSLALDALPGALGFYERFDPETAAPDDHSQIPCTWRDVGALRRAIEAELQGCTANKVVGIVYDIYLAWLAFLSTAAGRRTQCAIRSHAASGYAFHGDTFLTTIETCLPFREYLKAAIPEYRKAVLHEIRARAAKSAKVLAAAAATQPLPPRHDASESRYGAASSGKLGKPPILLKPGGKSPAGWRLPRDPGSGPERDAAEPKWSETLLSSDVDMQDDDMDGGMPYGGVRTRLRPKPQPQHKPKRRRASRSRRGTRRR
jgi:hypothetical protein